MPASATSRCASLTSILTARAAGQCPRACWTGWNLDTRRLRPAAAEAAARLGLRERIDAPARRLDLREDDDELRRGLDCRQGVRLRLRLRFRLGRRLDRDGNGRRRR